MHTTHTTRTMSDKKSSTSKVFTSAETKANDYDIIMQMLNATVKTLTDSKQVILNQSSYSEVSAATEALVTAEMMLKIVNGRIQMLKHKIDGRK